jgi:hypothetical protein
MLSSSLLLSILNRRFAKHISVRRICFSSQTVRLSHRKGLSVTVQENCVNYVHAYIPHLVRYFGSTYFSYEDECLLGCCVV